MAAVVERLDLTKIDCRLAVSSEPYGDYPIKIRCREAGHRDSEESMAVYRGRIQCYGCGFEIKRRLDALAYLLYGRYDDGTVRTLIRNHANLANYVGRDASIHGNRVQPRRSTFPSEGLAETWASLLWGIRRNRLSYLHGRGLTETSIRAAHLGHTGRRFTIPIYDTEGRLVTIRSRVDEVYGTEDFDWRTQEWKSSPKYKGMAGANQQYLYPAHWLADSQPRTVYVVEGELDALRLWQEGIPAVTITNGARNLLKLPELLKEWLPSVHCLVIAGDMDMAGSSATGALLEAAYMQGYQVLCSQWPAEWGKDVTEALKAHPLKEVLRVV